MSDSGIHLVYSTVPSEEEAAHLAKSLVEDRLAACANIIPGLRSIYRWQGVVEDERETLLLLKTDSGHVQTLIDRLVQLHSYDVPDIVAIPIDQAHPPYADWVKENTALS